MGIGKKMFNKVVEEAATEAVNEVQKVLQSIDQDKPGPHIDLALSPRLQIAAQILAARLSDTSKYNIELENTNWDPKTVRGALRWADELLKAAQV